MPDRRDGDGGFVLACGKSLDCTLCPNLVGGIPTPLKNMSSSVGIIIPNIWIIWKVTIDALGPPPKQSTALLVQWMIYDYGGV